MKFLTLVLIGFLLHAEKPVWLTDFSKAQEEAKRSHKAILLSFSGSDWCLPCIKMRKTIFETAAFESYAATSLILVNADFPRLRKHKLEKEQQKSNDALAERFNPSGKFPYTLVIDENGKVMKSWDGYANESPENFITEVKAAVHDHN